MGKKFASCNPFSSVTSTISLATMSHVDPSDHESKESSSCQVLFEYPRLSPVAVENAPGKPRIMKFPSADVIVLEEEKILQITDCGRKNANPISFTLREFMLFNGQADRGKLGIKIRESRFNNKEVLILVSSQDYEYISEINRGILASQGRKSREKCTPIASPSKWSPDMKKVRPRNTPIPSPLGDGSCVPTHRFGFGRELQLNPIASRLRSPQLKLPHSAPVKTTIPKPLNINDLSEEQQKVVQAVLSGESIFFTGGAGTGKSFLLKKLISLLPLSTTGITASTGIAACHIDGITLHQFLGIGRVDPHAPGVSAQVLSRIRRNPDKMEVLRKTKVLIIDEISLVDSKLFDLVHEILCGVRVGLSSEPFGGVQLVLSGDFLQLPPVPPQSTETGKPDNSSVKFCFESNVWKRVIKKSIHLTQIFRQSDVNFSNLLNEIRFGNCSERTAKCLLARVVHSSKSQSNVLKLLPLNKEVVALNEQQMAKLPRDVTKQTFSAIDTVFDPSFSPDTVCPVKSCVRLTVGCRVILVVTLSVSEKLVNGSVGTVVKFSASPSIPYVKFDGVTEAIGVAPYDWVFKQNGKEIARRRQIPLSLAWGVSIHKSQGMTLTACEVSLDKIFEAGQAYVALSRCKALESLSIISENPQGLTVRALQRLIRANPTCIEFYRKHFPLKN